MCDLNAIHASGPSRDDVVVFISPEDHTTKYLMRCVGLPNDTIEIRDKQLHVNGRLVPEQPTILHIDTTMDGMLIVQPRRQGGQDSRDILARMLYRRGVIL